MLANGSSLRLFSPRLGPTKTFSNKHDYGSVLRDDGDISCAPVSDQCNVRGGGLCLWREPNEARCDGSSHRRQWQTVVRPLPPLYRPHVIYFYVYGYNKLRTYAHTHARITCFRILFSTPPPSSFYSHPLSSSSTLCFFPVSPSSPRGARRLRSCIHIYVRCVWVVFLILLYTRSRSSSVGTYSSIYTFPAIYYLQGELSCSTLIFSVDFTYGKHNAHFGAFRKLFSISFIRIIIMFVLIFILKKIRRYIRHTVIC